MLTKSPAQIALEAAENIAAARALGAAPRIDIPDVMVEYREHADAVVAAEQAETQRRLRATRRVERENADRRPVIEAEIDERVRRAVNAAVKVEIGAVLDHFADAMGSAIGELLKRHSDPIEAKLAALEKVLDRLQRTLAVPHDARSERDFINVN